MDTRIPPLVIKIMLESNPLKPTMSLRTSAYLRVLFQHAAPLLHHAHMYTYIYIYIYIHIYIYIYGVLCVHMVLIPLMPTLALAETHAHAYSGDLGDRFLSWLGRESAALIPANQTHPKNVWVL